MEQYIRNDRLVYQARGLEKITVIIEWLTTCQQVLPALRDCPLAVLKFLP